MKHGFFRKLEKENLLKEYIDVFDWLFSEEKFISWNKENKLKYTNEIKKYVEKFHILFKKSKVKELQNIKITKEGYVYFSSKDSQGISVVKHIRNGIAHGYCDIVTKRGKKYITLRDYNKNKDTSAIICVPISKKE